MAGRVLRSSNGRFAGSTKGWMKGVKRGGGRISAYASAPSTSRFSRNRTDIYVQRTSGKLFKGKYSVKVRTVSKGELAAKRALIAASIAVPQSTGIASAVHKSITVSRRGQSKGQYTLARHQSLGQAIKTARTGRKKNRAIYKDLNGKRSW